ncbi:PTS sugar transporter subunit IIA [Schaalia suimastitidis]|uniref:PTS sugar transporter subunit IIA n=1 Tax=Schaalia suimastitidis TaxID=121163 RepID=UPI0004201BF4|nr:PTS glucose transporter subunit IIA [Schaalia suimastitidis]
MFGLGATKVEFVAPFAGQVIPVEDTNDGVFSQLLLGEGISVVPADDAGVVEVCAPVAGTIANIFNTRHAFTMVSTDGLEVLVHIGIGTVGLDGEGFEALVADGDAVEAGTPIVRVDFAAVRAAGKDCATPVVVSKRKQVKRASFTYGAAEAAQPIGDVTLA